MYYSEQKRNTAYVARNKIVKKAEAPELPLLNENQLQDMEPVNETGFINVRVNTASGALPVKDAVVTLYVMDQAANEVALYHLVTDISGKVPTMELPVSHDVRYPSESSEYYFSTYNLRVQAIGYYTHNVIDVRVFPNIATNYNITLIPVMQGGDEEGTDRTIIIPPIPADLSNL